MPMRQFADRPTIRTIIPIEELSLSERKEAKKNALQYGFDRAKVRGMAASPNELVVRAPRCRADFGTAAEGWFTAALAVLNNAYSVFQAVPTFAVANNNIIVWYGAACLTPTIAGGLPISLLTIGQGAAPGTTYAVFNMEDLTAYQIVAGYFSEPIVFEPTEVMNITVTCKVVTGLPAIVPLYGYILEPRGPVVSG